MKSNVVNFNMHLITYTTIEASFQYFKGLALKKKEMLKKHSTHAAVFSHINSF